MSIAWATVVLVVLLLPGFFLFWGFYAPNQVTRESVPASPLGQLAGVVIYGFFVHGIAYWIVNRNICVGGPGLVPCIDFDQFAALVRIDGAAPQGKRPPSLNEMLDLSIGWILAYFMVTAFVSAAIGYLAAILVGSGKLPLTRHRYLFSLEKARKQDAKSASVGQPSHAAAARLIRAHVLSKTTHDDLVLLYDGILKDFFAKADGTISYIVLRTPGSGTVKIAEGNSRRSGDTSPFGKATGDTAEAFFVITSDDIANVYFEPLLPLIRSDAGTKNLIKELNLMDLESPAPFRNTSMPT